MKPEEVGLSVEAGVPPQLQYADVPGTETMAAQPGTPPWPGIFVGAALVLTGLIVDDPLDEVAVAVVLTMGPDPVDADTELDPVKDGPEASPPKGVAMPAVPSGS